MDSTTYVDLTIEELMILHKQGNQKATVCLLGVFEGLINKHSRISKNSKAIDPDIRNSLMVTCLQSLNSFDISKYIENY